MCFRLLVEVVEDVGALVELLAVGQRQHRHLEQRIDRSHRVHVAENGEREVLEGNAVMRHGDGDAAHER